MKRTLRRVYTTLIFAVSFFALAACSNNDPDTGGSNKELPKFENLAVRVGSTGQITFNAYDVWTISSEKPWFKFDTETGPAGQHTINYTVTDDAIGFTDDETIVTFKITGNNQPATFKVTRTAKERTLKLFKLNMETYQWELTEKLDLAFAANAGTYNIGFKVIANYDWKITMPEWLSADADFLSGDANPDADAVNNPTQIPTSWLEINYAKALKEDMSGEVSFKDQKDASAAGISVAVTAPGAKNYMNSKAAATVAMRADGKYVVKKYNPESGKEEEIVHESYEFTLVAGSDNVDIFKVWKQNGYYGVDNGRGLEFEAKWCGVDALPANNVTVGPNVKEFGYELWCNPIADASRMVTIIAIPKALNKGYTEKDFVDMSTEQDILPEFQQYIVTEMSQELEKGISFAYPSSVYGITLRKMAEGSELDGIKSNYGVEMVYEMTYDSFESATMSMLKFTGFDVNDFSTQYVPAAAELTNSSGWLTIEIAQEASLVIISDDFVPFTASRNALLVFKSGGVNVIALKVTQNCPR